MLQFVLPVWLAIGLLPFIYVLSLYSTYKLIVEAIDRHEENWRVSWRAHLAVLTKFGFKTRDAQAFAGYWPRKIASATGFLATRALVAEFLQSRRDGERAVIEEQERKCANLSWKLKRLQTLWFDGIGKKNIKP